MIVLYRFIVSSARVITIDEKSRAYCTGLSKRGRLFFRDSVVRASREARSFWNQRVNPFGDIEESNRERTGYRTIQVLPLKSRSVDGRRYVNFMRFCFHPVSYSVFLELSQTTVEPVGELFPVRARLSDGVLGRRSRDSTRLQNY